MRRPTGSGISDRAFPIARFSRVPLRVGLEYGMTIQRKDISAPPVPLPVRSSLAQPLVVHRYQLSRNIRLLRNYGFAPGNPVLKAQSIPFQGRGGNTSPVLTRFGMQKPRPGATPVFPRVSSGGSMGAVRRFPKSLLVPPNTYRPPVYGDATQQYTDGG